MKYNKNAMSLLDFATIIERNDWGEYAQMTQSYKTRAGFEIQVYSLKNDPGYQLLVESAKGTVSKYELIIK